MPPELAKVEPTKLREMTTLCACLNARRAARLISQLYDATLRPAGVRSTQLPVLATIGWLGSMTLTALADAVVIDRTTLTRNLLLLERKGWLRSSAGADLRTREISLTPRGWELLRRAIPLWDKAQARVAAMLGEAGANRLLADLVRAVDQMKKPGRPSVGAGKR